ncbi:GNAT family N-acetyltransferase [Facklamia miroungae]|uniref:Acetyltransferase (GNAT) domain-containing protein n=1 Tax=Facklamia miroungae TaxID=120956 RepID=A0A1G7QIM9_9LACT|nr:GNAT family N-acetyltransferase [Facklamia miroungae]NKZ28955.1 GNAT family N-acetyltransferase [Facklamia miroungae]SDF98362.1 Acetyltransferase (GNAT) domain-containing protein [Facklamia miroungae]
MHMIVIKEDVQLPFDQTLALFENVHWTAYTREPDILEKAIQNSLKVWTAWKGEQLVGLVRVVGDGLTIIYIQDILVLENYQRQGVGSQLLQKVLKEYQSVRQIILLTDDTDITQKFYEKNGLVQTADFQLMTYMKK